LTKEWNDLVPQIRLDLENSERTYNFFALQGGYNFLETLSVKLTKLNFSLHVSLNTVNRLKDEIEKANRPDDPPYKQSNIYDSELSDIEAMIEKINYRIEKVQSAKAGIPTLEKAMHAMANLLAPITGMD
jgi:hypothetical protein